MITVAVDREAITAPVTLAGVSPDAHVDAQLILVGLPGHWLGFPIRTPVTASEVVTMDDPLKLPCARRRILPCGWRFNRSKKVPRPQFLLEIGRADGNFRYILKTLDGIERPAIAGQIPNATGGATTVLDLGANVDCTAQHLLQFAVMGAACPVLKGKSSPRWVCSILAKVIKGNEASKSR